MTGALLLLSLQGVLGAFDNLWNHEWRERLPSKRTARHELALHAVRGMLYAPVFLSFGWFAWQGLYGWLFVAVLALELVITLADFVEEDRSRRLAPLERVTHAILTLNYGAFLALAAPGLITALARPSGIVLVDRGWIGWLLGLYALGSFGFGLREALAAYRMRETVAGRRSLSAPARVVPATAPTGQTVLISGGSGFIGRAVVSRLSERGDRVIVLSRDPARARRVLHPAATIVRQLAEIPETVQINAVVNLAGAPIFGRPWTKTRKRTLVQSRIGTTRALVDWLTGRARRPDVLVSASAVGWYGASTEADSNDAELSEAAPVGGDFPAALCNAWEREAASAAAAGLRVCLLRFGLVLGHDGGLLSALSPAYRLGFGARIGGGRQWVSWIHRDDAVELITRALTDPLFSGTINATAPVPVRQGEFARALGRVLHRPVWLRIPTRLLRGGLGEMASLLVDGQRVIPRRALEIGFAFRYHDIESALRDLLTRRNLRSGATVKLLDHILS